MNTASPVLQRSLAVRHATGRCLPKDCSSFEGLAVDGGPGDGTGKAAFFSDLRVPLLRSVGMAATKFPAEPPQFLDKM